MSVTAAPDANTFAFVVFVCPKDHEKAVERKPENRMRNFRRLICILAVAKFVLDLFPVLAVTPVSDAAVTEWQFART
jgi:hypothetical protein